MSDAFAHHGSAAARPENVGADASVESVREALRHGPRGALVLAAVTTGMLFAAWLAFYFVLFIPRGPIE